MNKNDLFRAFDGVDEDILERSEAPAPRRAMPAFRKWGVLAACMALTVGLVGMAFATEAREYNTAVDFFKENGLSTEGLSRADVKAVYRDITTESFTNDKTAQVLERTVPGWEIDQREPTPEELEALWNRNFVWNPVSKTGYSYGVGCQEKPDEELGFDVLDRSYLECYQDGALLWTAEFPDLFVEDGVHTSAGTAVWGHNDTWSSEQPVHSSLARLDENGNILWQRQLDHGFEREYIAAVVDNGDRSEEHTSELQSPR